MSLAVINRTIADAKIQAISLLPVLGGHEFILNLHASVHPRDEISRYLVVHSARVSVRSKSGTAKDLGRSFTDHPFIIRQFGNPAPTSAHFQSLLLPQQLAALEDHRDGGDLNFDVTLLTTGGDEKERFEFHFRATEVTLSPSAIRLG